MQTNRKGKVERIGGGKIRGLINEETIGAIE